MKLILVRHGAVEGIDPPRFRGRKDLPLTDLGKCQAQATAVYLAAHWQIAEVITSPLGRCTATGAVIAEAAGAPMRTTKQLLDFDYGEWAWKTHPEVQQQSPQLYRLWFTMPQLVRIPGGDSLQDLLLRTSEALRSIIHRNAGQTVVAVAHDSVNRALLVQLLDLPLSAFWRLRQDPCCINEIEVGECVLVRSINSTGHLEIT